MIEWSEFTFVKRTSSETPNSTLSRRAAQTSLSVVSFLSFIGKSARLKRGDEPHERLNGLLRSLI